MMEQQPCREFIEVFKPGLSEWIPTAPYIHSKAHVLNLAIVHSSSDVSVKPMMAFTFQNSTKNG
jgi:hypothetical protein